MKTGMMMDCQNCGPKSRVESIEIGRDGDQVVNQLRCEKCKQVCNLGRVALQQLAIAAENQAEPVKVANGAHAHKGKGKDGGK